MKDSSVHFPTWLLLALAGPIASPLFAQVEDIGADSSFGFFISGDGQTGYGQLSAPGGVVEPHRWTSIGGIEQLANPFPFIGTANAISDDGSVVIGFSYDGPIGPGEPRALLWDAAGVATELTPPGSVASDAFQMSGDGLAYAGIYREAPTNWHACVWDAAGVLTDIHPAFGGSFSTVIDMSHDGSTVLGRTTDPAGDTRNFIWRASTGSVELLPSSAGQVFPSSITADGSAIAGRISLPNLNDSGIFYWSAATGYVVSDPSVGEPTQASISNDGSRVYGLVDLNTLDNSAAIFTWTPAGGFQFDDPNMQLTLAAGSFDGSVLVGSMGGSGFDKQAYRWTSATSFVPLASNGLASFASSVSLDGTVATGALLESPSDRRAVIWSESGVIGANYCGPAVPNSSGAAAEIRLGGSNITSVGALDLTASDLPVNTFGFFIASSDQGFVPMPAGSFGNLCLSGSIARLDNPGQIFQSGAMGTATVTIDPISFDGPAGPILPPFGERWYFQAWFRDANPNVSSNFTDGATVPLF